ncbi:MAG: hypothetical protein AB7S39_08500 [Gemmatimonadales bacterium]
MTDWQPYREPLRRTLTRTIAIAVVVAGVFSAARGMIPRWPLVTLVMLWPAFGGHWVDILFLNRLRSRLPEQRAIHVAVRLAVWFAGGVVLAAGMWYTAWLLPGLRPPAIESWRWPLLAGAGFIAVEMVAHAVLLFRGHPSFFNGRG